MFFCHFKKWFYLNFNSLFFSSLRRCLLRWNSLLLQLLSFFLHFKIVRMMMKCIQCPRPHPGSVINPILRNETVSFFLFFSRRLCSNHSRILSFISIVACVFFLLPLFPSYPSETFFVSAALTASYPPAINNKTAKHFRYSTVCLWGRESSHHSTFISSPLSFFLRWNCERSFFSRSPLL